MTCDLCGQNEAKVVIYFSGRHSTATRRRLFVCRPCAEKFSVAHLLEKKEELRQLERRFRRECPFCHLSEVDFRTQGLLGCPYCYSVFEEELGKKISREGIRAYHVGKVPVRWWREKRISRTISRMLAEFRRCIDEENYEKAEYFKNLIDRLRARLP